jgi:short-subunit dehydrogenase
VLSFSEALHHELAPRGVRVTALCPGPVPTEFQARAGMTRVLPAPLLTCTPEQVARAGYRGLAAGRRVVVPGLANRLVTVAIRFVPRALLLAATEAVQRRWRQTPP